MRVLSLDGAGAVRQHVTHDLAEFSDFSEIVIGDYDLGVTQGLAAEIGDPRLQDLQIDGKDYESWSRSSKVSTSS